MKRLLEEYFGGELNGRGQVLINKWQYHALQQLKAGNIELPEWTAPVGPAYIDPGARAMNSRAPTKSDLAAFIKQMQKAGYIDAENKLLIDREYRLKRPQDYPRLSGPRGGFIELTNACHLKCITCYNEFTRSSERQRLDTEKLIDILDQFERMGANWIALTGGETTLAPGWDEIARHSIEDCGFTTRIYTCGIYPEQTREKTIQKLNDLKPDEIRITYAGLKEMNDKVRRSRRPISTFDEITRTICDLAQQKVKLNYILAHENAAEVEGFLVFIDGLSQRLGKRIAVNLGPVRAYGNASLVFDQPFSTPTKEDFYRTNNKVETFRQLGMDISINFDMVSPLTSGQIQQRRERLARTPRPYLPQGCGLGKTGISVGYDGTVSICGIMGNAMTDEVIRIVQSDPQRYAGIDPAGLRAGRSLADSSLEDIWFDSPLLKYFQVHYRKEQCEPCEKYMVACHGICPAMAQLHGDMRAGDSGCFRDLL